MKAFAYVSIIQAILKLAIVYVLVLGDFDRLILYGVLNTLVACSIRIIYSIYVKRNIPECKMIGVFTKKKYVRCCLLQDGTCLVRLLE